MDEEINKNDKDCNNCSECKSNCTCDCKTEKMRNCQECMVLPDECKCYK